MLTRHGSFFLSNARCLLLAMTLILVIQAAPRDLMAAGYWIVSDADVSLSGTSVGTDNSYCAPPICPPCPCFDAHGMTESIQNQIWNSGSECHSSPYLGCDTWGVATGNFRISGENTGEITIHFGAMSKAVHDCEIGADYISDVLNTLSGDFTLNVAGIASGTEITIHFIWSGYSYVDKRAGPEGGEPDQSSVEDAMISLDFNPVFMPNLLDISTPGTNGVPAMMGSIKHTVGDDLDVSIWAEVVALADDIGIRDYFDEHDWEEAGFEGYITLKIDGPPNADIINIEDLQLLFSEDIGSDKEFSDPYPDGEEVFDPGDMYLWFGDLPTGGQDGLRNDEYAFQAAFVDPPPEPPSPSPYAVAPTCQGDSPDDIITWYFDLDGYDALGISLLDIVNPNHSLSEPYDGFDIPSDCFITPDHLIVSYDDDESAHYAGLIGPPLFCPVPVSSVASMGYTYGTSSFNDEVVNISLTSLYAGTPAAMQFECADESKIHTDMGPNPDSPNTDYDDDVDALDVTYEDCGGIWWLFSADHEATYFNIANPITVIDPGAIYQAGPPDMYPVKIVDPVIHLGLPAGTDIDAFEFVRMPDPDAQPEQEQFVLALLFSVDDDDWLVWDDESGGLDPNMIYYSYLTGTSWPLLSNSLEGDIDAIAAWRDPIFYEDPDYTNTCPPAFEWGMVTDGYPDARLGHSMVYNAVGNTPVMYGGSETDNTAYSWNGSTWTPRLVFGDVPIPRYDCAMAYDVKRDKIFMFGGRDQQAVPATVYGDFWELDFTGGHWTEITPTGDIPSARTQAKMIYDIENDVFVLFGGGDNGTLYGDTYEYDPDTQVWTLISSGGSGEPGAGGDHYMVYDPVEKSTVLYGEDGGIGKTWEYKNQTWSQLFPSADPGDRALHRMVFNGLSGRIQLYGNNSTFTPLRDLWELDRSINSWIQVDDGSAAPGAHFQVGMTFDPARRQTVLFGGYDWSIFSAEDETWVYPLNSITKAYTLTGASTGTGWSWCVTGPDFSVCDFEVPGVTSGSPADAIAERFAYSINGTGCEGLIAAAYGNVLQITVGGQKEFSLCVGPPGDYPDCCLPSGVVSCSFQPDIAKVILTGNDCNGNLIDDAIDIANGTSNDNNQDDVPDECIRDFICGDANNDDNVNILDIVYIINYIYKNGPDPIPPDAAEVDGQPGTNILDIVYLINYLYKNGPDPECP